MPWKPLVLGRFENKLKKPSWTPPVCSPRLACSFACRMHVAHKRAAGLSFVSPSARLFSLYAASVIILGTLFAATGVQLCSPHFPFRSGCLHQCGRCCMSAWASRASWCTAKEVRGVRPCSADHQQHC